MGAESDAYVSRGILACPQAGDREALDSSRHRMTAICWKEGLRQQVILLQVKLGSGWNLGGPGMLFLLGSGQPERKERPQTLGPVCLLPRPLGRPQAFYLLGPGKPGVPSLQSGLGCNA